MTPFLGELLGTAVFAFLGTAVSLNARLPRTEGSGMGWPAVAAGWGAAFALGMLVAGHSGAHLNPALTFSAWLVDRAVPADAWTRVAGQAAGAAAGIALAWASSIPHWTRSPGAAAAAMVRAPAVVAPASTFLASALGSAAFLFVMLRLVAGAPFAGVDEAAAEGVLPGARTPFVATNPGEAALLGGLAFGACILGIGGSGASIDPFGSVLGRAACLVLPASSRPALRAVDALLGAAGCALGAIAAAALWRASVA